MGGIEPLEIDPQTGKIQAEYIRVARECLHALYTETRTCTRLLRKNAHTHQTDQYTCIRVSVPPPFGKLAVVEFAFHGMEYDEI
jgi:hypothetical protein